MNIQKEQGSGKGALLLIAGGVVALALALWFALASQGNNDTAKLASGQMSAEQLESTLKAGNIDPAERSAIEAIVRDYILKHPELITDALDALEQKKSAGAIDSIRDALHKPFAEGFIGNANGDVTLIEFSDYACGYCKQSVADVERLVAEDKGLKVVFRELPILSASSKQAALWSLAAAEQGKYGAFHSAMFDTGRPSTTTIESAATAAGMDLDKARARLKAPEFQYEIDQNLEMARTLNATGTPTFVVGNEVIFGAAGYDALKAAIAKARGQ